MALLYLVMSADQREEEVSDVGDPRERPLQKFWLPGRLWGNFLLYPVMREEPASAVVNPEDSHVLKHWFPGRL